MKKTATAFLTICTLLPLSLQAATGNPTPTNDKEWRFTVAFPMLWAPDIDGKVRGGTRQDFTIPFDQILEGLDFGLMGELYATRGPFGLAVRFNYMDLSTTENSSEGLADTTVEVGIKAGINDLLASWQVHEKVRILTGLRHVHNKVVLDIDSRIGDIELINERLTVSDEDAFDLLVGMTFDHWFSDRWGIIVNADVGVIGDNDRDYNAELRGIYRFGKLNNIWFGYRHLRIGNDSVEDGIEDSVDMTQSGPMLGWAFTF
jgi:hypothetical protein